MLVKFKGKCTYLIGTFTFKIPKDKRICAQDGQIHIMPPKSQIERPIAKPRRSTVIKNPVQLPSFNVYAKEFNACLKKLKIVVK